MRSRLTLDGMAIGAVVIAGFVEAAQQALSDAPNVSAHLPKFVGGSFAHYLPLILVTLAGMAWLADAIKRNFTPSVPPPKEKLHTSTESIGDQMEYFQLGLDLGKSYQFDDRLLTDLSQLCHALGLQLSSAKIDRILDSFHEERNNIEVEGGTITKTLALFNFQMGDLEDVIRTELAHTGITKSVSVFTMPEREKLKKIEGEIEELSTQLNARFNIGFLIGQLKGSGFDLTTITELKNTCDHLGLTYTAARLQRILDAREMDQFRHEEFGTMDISNTEKVFDSEIKDMGSVVLKELERLRRT